MQSEFGFKYLGSRDQAMAAALKLVPDTAVNVEIKISYVPGLIKRQDVVVRFANFHSYTFILNPLDFFNPKGK
ncbi:hypothetical protein ACTXGO_00945 [Psychrobacter sp. T6-1]|uniref:hypothetical protein n=1 Tax=Psychrobacter sp. T6-1 TaxID=3457447 RepID=UPI003FD196A0